MFQSLPLELELSLKLDVSQDEYAFPANRKDMSSNYYAIYKQFDKLKLVYFSLNNLRPKTEVCKILYNII